MNVFEMIRATVDMKQVAGMYGQQVSRSGMICCPFHEDKHPSMKLNKDYFYCFGCGATGDATEFVSRLFDLSSYEAAQKIAADFGLSTDSSLRTSVTAELVQRKNAQTLREKERLCVSVLTDYLWLLRDWRMRYAPRLPESEIDSRYVEACHRLDYVEYLLDELTQESPAERSEIVTMLNDANKIQKLQSRLKRLREERCEYEQEIC